MSVRGEGFDERFEIVDPHFPCDGLDCPVCGVPWAWSDLTGFVERDFRLRPEMFGG